MSDLNPCLHNQFKAEVTVANAVDSDGRIVARFAEVTVFCSICFIPFKFIGIDKVGADLERPTIVAEDQTVARMPIEPI